MDKMIKVYNDMLYDIGIVQINGIERNIRPSSFTLLSRDDVEYIVSIARELFEEPHQLRIDDDEINIMIGLKSAPNEKNELSSDVENIRKMLSGRANALREWLDKITQGYMLDLVFRTAEGMDLPQSKMKILMEKMPERFE